MKRWLLLCSLLFLALPLPAADIMFNGVKPQVVIDVRTPAEFAEDHLDGALNIPLERIAKNIVLVKGITKASPILVYCRSGRRSAAAAQTLTSQGYKNILDGGDLDSLRTKLKR